MTWSASARVTRIEHHASNGHQALCLVASCAVDDQVLNLDDGRSYPAIVATTEGEIEAVELRVVIGGTETAVRVGDHIVVTGHFRG